MSMWIWENGAVKMQNVECSVKKGGGMVGGQLSMPAYSLLGSKGTKRTEGTKGGSRVAAVYESYDSSRNLTKKFSGMMRQRGPGKSDLIRPNTSRSEFFRPVLNTNPAMDANGNCLFARTYAEFEPGSESDRVKV